MPKHASKSAETTTPALSWLAMRKPLAWGLGAGLALVPLTLLIPNHYASEARLLPVADGKAGALANLGAAAAALGLASAGGEGADANFVDILGSRTLGEQLLGASFTYGIRPWRFGAEERRTTTLSAYLEARTPDQALQALQKILTTFRDPKTKVVTLRIETRSPELSQQAVQRALKLLETFVQEKGRTRGGAKAAFAEARLREAREEAMQAEGALRTFLDGNRNYAVSTDPAVRLKGIRLEGELKLRQQLLATLAMNREQALMEEKNDIPILNIMDPGNLPTEKSRPSRSVMVLSGMLLALIGAWVAQYRHWILAQLTARDMEQQEAK